MGRPKKIKTEEVVDEPSADALIIPTVEEPVSPPSLLKRNQYGLYDNIKYSFKTNGFVDWRNMISSEHIVLNRENLLKRENPIDIDTLSEEELETLKQKAYDKDILIKLSGYKELAQLRGFTELLTTVEYFADSNLAKANCIIKWVGNYETDGLPVTSNGNADACPENTNGFASKFLIAIAENRAIIRAIRGFLQIHIAGQDELKNETPSDFRESGPVLLLSGPQGAIAKKLKDSKRTLAELVQFILTKYEYSVSSPEIWNKVQDIPAADATFILDKFDEFLNSRE